MVQNLIVDGQKIHKWTFKRPFTFTEPPRLVFWETVWYVTDFFESFDPSWSMDRPLWIMAVHMRLDQIVLSLENVFCVFFASFYGFFLNRIARYGSCAFCIPFHSISFRSDLIKVLFLIKVKILLKPEMVSFAVTCGSKFIFKTRNHKTTINSIILYNLYNMLK